MADQRTWRDFQRPADAGYYEERFRYLSQGDVLLGAPMLVPTAPLLIDGSDEEGFIAAVPIAETPAMILTPTCDFRRRSAGYLAEHADEDPYQLRQQLVVARVLPFEEWERAQPPEGRSDRVAQVRAFDNLRQYMYLPRVGPLRESLADLGTTWTLPLSLVRPLQRLTQLTEAGTRQLQYKLVMYGTSVVIDRESLRPPMD